MTRCPFRFVLEVQDAHGEVLHRRALDPDWEPAVQWAHLAGARTYLACASTTPASHVEPVWHASGAPVVAGIRVRMATDDMAWSEDCPADAYFGDTTRAVVAALLADGTLKPDDSVRLVVAAYPADLAVPAPPAFQVAERAPRWTARDRDFAARLSAALPCGSHDPIDLEVLISDAVVEEMVRLAQSAGDREIGGVLIGHVCTDAEPRALGVEVTAQIPARHAVGEAAKLTFTSDTWTDVRAALALRRRNELLLGWWHSHPADAWCKACPMERQRACQLATGFMSPDDRALHRAMFPAAFSQAVVVTRSVLGTHAAWFGWRRGTLQRRGFRMSPTAAHAAPLAWAAVDAPAGPTTAACTTDAAAVELPASVASAGKD